MPVKSEVSTFPGITLLLDAIQDPGNLGTMVRTADWFGNKNIICGEGCVDGYHPKMIQSTMGSIFRVNLIYQELTSFIDQHPGIPVVASSLEGQMLDHAKRGKTGFSHYWKRIQRHQQRGNGQGYPKTQNSRRQRC
jgi:tRNA G18 (ribose-2'-O)-methylase SpoU